MGGSKRNERNNGDERKMGGSKGTKETMRMKEKWEDQKERKKQWG